MCVENLCCSVTISPSLHPFSQFLFSLSLSFTRYLLFSGSISVTIQCVSMIVVSHCVCMPVFLPPSLPPLSLSFTLSHTLFPSLLSLNLSLSPSLSLSLSLTTHAGPLVSFHCYAFDLTFLSLVFHSICPRLIFVTTQ